MSKPESYYSFLQTYKQNHPFPTYACAIAELRYIQFLATYALNKTPIHPKTISIRSNLLQTAQLTAIDKPYGFGINTSLVIDSPDPKYLGVILYE